MGGSLKEMQPFKSRPLPPPWRRALVGMHLKTMKRGISPTVFWKSSICEVEKISEPSDQWSARFVKWVHADGLKRRNEVRVAGCHRGMGEGGHGPRPMLRPSGQALRHLRTEIAVLSGLPIKAELETFCQFPQPCWNINTKHCQAHHEAEFLVDSSSDVGCHRASVRECKRSRFQPHTQYYGSKWLLGSKDNDAHGLHWWVVELESEPLMFVVMDYVMRYHHERDHGVDMIFCREFGQRKRERERHAEDTWR